MMGRYPGLGPFRRVGPADRAAVGPHSSRSAWRRTLGPRSGRCQAASGARVPRPGPRSEPDPTSSMNRPRASTSRPGGPDTVLDARPLAAARSSRRRMTSPAASTTSGVSSASTGGSWPTGRRRSCSTRTCSPRRTAATCSSSGPHRDPRRRASPAEAAPGERHHHDTAGASSGRHHEPLQYEFFVRASPRRDRRGRVRGRGDVHVLRGFAFMGDALSHAAFPAL